MSVPPIISVRELTHRYGDRLALDHLTLSVHSGELFAILGPNGGGKTTLFRVLSTLLRPQEGTVEIAGFDLLGAPATVRQQMGVVFQAPSLDKKLTVRENLWCQGRLYGLSTGAITQRGEILLSRLGLADRAHETVEKLSGGLKRRVEIAKALLHQPRILLLDEPSTGLDPLVRSELWSLFQELRQTDQITILLTTHLLEEADKADRIAILHQGRLVACDSPATLRGTIAGESLTVQTSAPAELARTLQEKLGITGRIFADSVRYELPAATEWIARIYAAVPGRIDSLTLGRPSLEDVFIARTGCRFDAAAA
ncbi:MAG: ABC transporter ATP-binding protein [Pirellulales bacterium]|nr:ABC transporter ATP-binding protein [Pirellulales bacterium]